MRVDSIELFRIPCDLEIPSDGRAPRESVVVLMRSGDKVGLGEVNLAKSPTECEEWSSGAFACLRDWLAPALVGQSVDSGEGLQELLQAFQGNDRAKSGLDCAWWFLTAVVQDKPLHQLLDGGGDVVRVSYEIGPNDDTQRWWSDVRSAIERCELVVLKVRPGWDVEMLRAVRQEFAAEPLAIDCDGAFGLSHQEMFYRMEDFNLRFIEQPLAADDLVGHAMLQSSIRTPICLDQSIASLERMEQAIDLGSCRMARLDIARVGGLTPAIAIRDACTPAKISCGVEGTGLGLVAIVADLALATSCDLPMTARWGGPQVAGGSHIRLSQNISAPGLTLDAAELAKLAIEHALIR
jgi:o-succinylbenzoate synthase